MNTSQLPGWPEKQQHCCNETLKQAEKALEGYEIVPKDKLTESALLEIITRLVTKHEGKVNWSNRFNPEDLAKAIINHLTKD